MNPRLGSILFVLGNITLFATFYTLGVVISLVGTGFLVGFQKQLSMMWDPVRRYAAGIFLLCIALVFVFAFALRIDVLVIVFAICTFLSYACASSPFIIPLSIGADAFCPILLRVYFGKSSSQRGGCCYSLYQDGYTILIGIATLGQSYIPYARALAKKMNPF